MSEHRFKIVFDGTLLPGVDINTAKLNLAALYKSEVAAVERLFSGQPVTLKRDLSQIDAQTYLQALKNTGIDARLEPEPVIELSLSDVRDHAPAVTEPDSPYAPPQADVAERVPEYALLKPFSIEGRIGRLRFLAWSMVLSLVTIAVVGVFALIALALVSTDSTAGLIAGGILAFVLCVVFLIATILISVQRLHDVGWSGWLWLLNLVPFVGSFFPLLLVVLPGSVVANRYGAPPPPNSTAVKVLSSLWLVLIALMIVGAMAGGISAIQDTYENTLENSYQSGSVTTDEIEVEVEPTPNSTDDAAEQAQPPVDSAQE
ncbi:Uncharacterized membrane protein YhaH, DUF805 family [Pseudomonas mohnii]|uniref:Uncharacterized membrane protein YhaH, DUF805 family n=1 Tax=Pseudomonas mohnii TaxID=395600 RepID=A0ABY0Y4T7_9PSED|nr:DUF805 domain-containing protein [Pseudomonas mohnii]SEC93780.1 Uncharacterized membrane protein YhaH, DUF805 family [Pseudomonas mohnii]